jgi:hypothetical protein
VNLADLFAAVSLGSILTGVCVAIIQIILGFLNHRASLRMKPPDADPNQFLDWLATLVLGPKRLDHEPMYSCTISALFLAGLCWLIVGPIPTSPIFTLPAKTQVTLATCLFTGSGTCLYGVFMGTFMDIGRQVSRAKRKLRKEPPLPPLDVRRSYRVGSSGIPAVFAALSYYTVILIEYTPANWAGANSMLLIFLCLGFFFQWLRFLMENRRINHALPVLIEHEMSRRELAAELHPGQEPKGMAP